MTEIEEYRKIVQKILEAFTNIPFIIVVESATDKIVKPVDMEEKADRDLISDIEVIANGIMYDYSKKMITPDEYRKVRKKSTKTFRPNEVSVFLEYIFPKKFEG